VGIFVGWIVQRRWLTIGAFVLCLVGVFAFPLPPTPLRYLWLLTPALLLSAVVYERGALLGVPVSQRLRLGLALWMGGAGLVLMVGIVLAGSNTAGLAAAVAAFSVLAMAGGRVPLAL
jgi:hypothetical protein